MSNTKNHNNETMSASFYYYGCESNEWDEMNYFRAIKDRKEKAFKLWGDLYSVYDQKKPTFDDHVRLQKVYQAYQDNDQLLDERAERAERAEKI